MLPADDEVTSGRVVVVSLKLAAPKLEFNANTFERPVLAAELGVAIGEAILDAFDDESQLGGQHAE
jgi:hypothetical protein